MDKFHFISYSAVDGFDLALRLCDELQIGPPSIETWLDKRRLQADADWDKQIVEAIRDCESLIFVMTRDSVEDASVCKNEWVQALKYKKPIVLVLLQHDAASAKPRNHLCCLVKGWTCTSREVFRRIHGVMVNDCTVRREDYVGTHRA